MKNKLAPLAIALTAAVLGTFAVLKTPVADADHLWTGVTTEDDTVYWCWEAGLPASWQNAYVFAAARWNSSPSDWHLVYGTNCGDFTADRRNFNNLYWPTIPGVTFQFIVSNELLLAETYLNTYFTWSFSQEEGSSMGDEEDPCLNYCDVVTILVHEMGHWVELDHGDCTSSVMCVNYKVRRFLSSHDSDTLVDIYGE